VDRPTHRNDHDVFHLIAHPADAHLLPKVVILVAETRRFTLHADHLAEDGGGHHKEAARFNPKKGFRKDYIDEKLFINKEAGVTETDHYTATHKFVDFGIAEQLSANLTSKGLIIHLLFKTRLFRLSSKARDVIGIASTGTGKTAAFLIPLINKLVANNDQKIMILTPTRELAHAG
jgi:hypothetical protein